jgi:phage terminase small subunit
MTTMGDSSRQFSIVPPGGGDGTLPSHWPECPAYLSAGQQRRFYAVCQRLDDQGTLETADVSVIEALAIAEDNLETATTYTNAEGRYATVVKQSRPYQCPACKGSGQRPMPKGTDVPAPPSTSEGPARKGPGRPCSICAHPQRAEIDAALGRSETFRNIAKRYGVGLGSAVRHKQEHLGKPAKPVLVRTEDRTCLGCGGRGVIIPETKEVSEKRPETTDQRYAIDQVSMLSAKLGLDVTSRVRVKGKPAERKSGSRFKDLQGRHARQ